MAFAAKAMAERSTFGHPSWSVATRLQSVKRRNMVSRRLRRLYRRLSFVAALPRQLRPGMQCVNSISTRALRKPIYIIATIPKRPVGGSQLTHKRSRPFVVAHLADGHKEPNGVPTRVGQSMQLCVLTTFGRPDQVLAPASRAPNWRLSGGIEVGCVD